LILQFKTVLSDQIEMFDHCY